MKRFVSSKQANLKWWTMLLLLSNPFWSDEGIVLLLQFGKRETDTIGRSTSTSVSGIGGSDSRNFTHLWIWHRAVILRQATGLGDGTTTLCQNGQHVYPPLSGTKNFATEHFTLYGYVPRMICFFTEQLRLASPRLQDCCEVRKCKNS